MEDDQQYDFFIYGTGLTESILSAAFSAENKVLHVDSNTYYGKDWASLGWNELKNWAKTLNLLQDSVYCDAELVINDESPMDMSRVYSFSLTPATIYSKSKIIDLIISYNLQPYLSFKSYNCILIYDESLENFFFEVPYKKEVIAFREDIDFVWKRKIMRFIEFILDITSEKNQEILKCHENDLLADFLSSEPFSLSTLYINMFVYGIAFSNTHNITVKEALPKIKQFFLSIGIYTDFAILNCSYGGGSELVQAFSRNASLKNSTYMLGKYIVSYNINENESYPLTVVLDNNTEVKCKKLITSCKIGNYHPNILLKDKSLVRSICLIKGNLSRMFKENGLILCSFPPQSLKSNKYPLQMIVHGSNSGDCPSGQYVIYTSTFGTVSEEKSSIMAAIQILIEAASVDTAEAPQILFTLFYLQNSVTSVPCDSQYIIPVQNISFDTDFNKSVENANNIYNFLLNKDLVLHKES